MAALPYPKGRIFLQANCSTIRAISYINHIFLKSVNIFSSRIVTHRNLHCLSICEGWEFIVPPARYKCPIENIKLKLISKKLKTKRRALTVTDAST